MSQAVTDYTVVSEPSLFKLEESVRKMLKDGWEPQGGVTVVPGEFAGTETVPALLSQPMVHRGER